VADIAGIVLYNILKDPENSLEVWPKLKSHFFNKNYGRIYNSIVKYYNKHNSLPSFESLKLTLREEGILQQVRALEFLTVPEDIDNEIAFEALQDEVTQDEALDLLSNFVSKISTYDSVEIKNNLSEIVLTLEERTDTSEDIFMMNDILVIDEQEVHNKVPLGFNNTFDADTGGIALTELYMIGGRRGSGKTVAACNAATNQYLQGNSCIFFSIEMRGREIFDRWVSILSGAKNSRIRKMTCTPEELESIAKVRTDMFLDGEEVFQDYLSHKNYEQFEIDLIRSKRLKPDNQLVIVDNQQLTLADIDMNIKKFKTKFGDKLKVVVVDYLNAINMPDLYNWATQITLSRKLKEFARKYNVVMITPYQTDSSGEARFSKGILDKADVSVVLDSKDNYIEWESSKTRNIAPFKYNSPVNWETFEIFPQDAVIPEEGEEEKTEEKANDAPWN
jgi:replicative DNA helicase